MLKRGIKINIDKDVAGIERTLADLLLPVFDLDNVFGRNDDFLDLLAEAVLVDQIQDCVLDAAFTAGVGLDRIPLMCHMFSLSLKSLTTMKT